MTVTAEIIRQWQRTGQALELIDIREVEPQGEERIPGAAWVHVNQLEPFMHTLTESTLAVLICAVGIRSELHAEALRIDGHKNIFSLEGGSSCMLQPLMN